MQTGQKIHLEIKVTILEAETALDLIWKNGFKLVKILLEKKLYLLLKLLERIRLQQELPFIR